VEEYQLPFEDEVGQHPTLEDMQDVVVQRKHRPQFREQWSSHAVSVGAWVHACMHACMHALCVYVIIVLFFSCLISLESNIGPFQNMKSSGVIKKSLSIAFR